MCLTDITKNNLYINKIINVIKSYINNHHKLLHVSSRHSDAFVYILSGSCTYAFSDGIEFTVNEGDILYLSHYSEYTMHIRTDNYSFIFCDFEFYEPTPRKCDVYTPGSSEYAKNLFLKLLNHKDSFPEALALLYNIYAIIITTANKGYVSKSSKNKISELRNYIDANFADESLSVSFLAQKAGISETYFRKLFKQQYNLSPSQYIITVRLQRAKTLMNYPFLSLEDCALQSGFSSLQYFCRIFKRITGMTPSEYRRE